MKTLNQNFTLYKDKKSSAPAVLAVFHFAGGDVFVSDRTIAPGAGAPEFRGLVTSWGEVSAPSSGLFTVKLPEVALELANSGEPPFSSYLDDGGAEGAEAELFLWFEGLGYAEKEPVGRFIISSPIEYADERVRLTLVSAFIKRNRLIGRTIARDDYPGADPDAVGG
ncbi:MAG TPA: hypothetical protein VJM83_06640, partial [Nitrospirota bacterium]|nr:hypothetical protein [Nitrospirota bacterium]